MVFIYGVRIGGWAGAGKSLSRLYLKSLEMYDTW